MNLSLEWEIMQHNKNSIISRAKVIGGWVVNSLTESPTRQMSESMVFIPDPEHKWVLKN